MTSRRNSIIKVTVTGDVSDLQRAFGKATSGASQFGQDLDRMGSRLTRNVTLPLLALGGAAGKLASDLSESTNAVSKVFGDASDSVLAFGENASQAIGISNAEFNQLAAVTGAILQGLQFDQDEAAAASIRLSERAADMASVFNTDVSDAIESITSALKGERDPIEKYGVSLNEATVKAKALEMGLADATGEIGLQAKALATIELIMEQTDRIAGDFADTQDEAANATRRAQAAIKDAGASIGEDLLPYVAEAASAIADLAGNFNQAEDSTKGMIVQVAILAAAAGPLVKLIGLLFRAAGAIGAVTSGAAVATGTVAGLAGALTGLMVLLDEALRKLPGGLGSRGLEGAPVFGPVIRLGRSVGDSLLPESTGGVYGPAVPTDVNVNVNGSVITDQDLAAVIRDELTRTDVRNARPGGF